MASLFFTSIIFMQPCGIVSCINMMQIESNIKRVYGNFDVELMTLTKEGVPLVFNSNALGFWAINKTSVIF